ncbi:MAG TPA: HAMP domain-containing protein, partial [Gemmataceae bacterium]|nr:HAMP domain-containing protein [Gemmataceae bacterium]
MFWRLFTTHAVLLLSSVGLLALVIVERVEQPDLRHTVWTAAALLGLAALGLARWLAQRITDPIQATTAGMEQIAGGTYSHKIYMPDSDKLAPLVQRFNRMSERLAAEF